MPSARGKGSQHPWEHPAGCAAQPQWGPHPEQEHPQGCSPGGRFTSEQPGVFMVGWNAHSEHVMSLQRANMWIYFQPTGSELITGGAGRGDRERWQWGCGVMLPALTGAAQPWNSPKPWPAISCSRVCVCLLGIQGAEWHCGSLHPLCPSHWAGMLSAEQHFPLLSHGMRME